MYVQNRRCYAKPIDKEKRACYNRVKSRKCCIFTQVEIFFHPEEKKQDHAEEMQDFQIKKIFYILGEKEMKKHKKFLLSTLLAGVLALGVVNTVAPASEVSGNAATVPAPIELVEGSHRLRNGLNIDIKINGEWVNVVNVSETELVKKEEGKTWVETYQGMTANQVLMDPNRIDSYNSTTTTFTMTYVEATPCAEHNDGNSDGVCDRCFKRIPHELWDIDENGKCDDCQKTYCESCTDADNDGTCDECYHFVENYVEPPVGGDPNGGGTNSGNNGNNGNNSSSGKKGGCKGAIGGVTAGAILGLGAVCTLLKKKRK